MALDEKKIFFHYKLAVDFRSPNLLLVKSNQCLHGSIVLKHVRLLTGSTVCHLRYMEESLNFGFPLH